MNRNFGSNMSKSQQSISDTHLVDSTHGFGTCRENTTGIVVIVIIIWYIRWDFNLEAGVPNMTKPTKWYVRSAKTQISLCILPAWSESSLSAWRNVGPLTTYWVHSEDSDQTGRMPRLIWVFAVRTSFCWFCHAAAHLWCEPRKIVTR